MDRRKPEASASLSSFLQAGIGVRRDGAGREAARGVDVGEAAPGRETAPEFFLIAREGDEDGAVFPAELVHQEQQPLPFRFLDHQRLTARRERDVLDVEEEPAAGGLELLK
jgi:hypothetical protein